LTAKKKIASLFRGWIPKEPSIPTSRIKMTKMNPPKVVRIVIMVGVLALMTFVAITFLVPFMAESSINNAIVWTVRLLAVGTLVGLAVYLKRRGNYPEDSKSQLFVEMMFKKYRSRPIYLVLFGLAFGFMLSGLVVAMWVQPLSSTL
jgi:predicted MFS family arabinose efflux permease